MNKQPVVVRSGESETLNVTGAEVRLLCEGDRTGQAWSVSECTAPENSGGRPSSGSGSTLTSMGDAETIRMVGRAKMLNTSSSNCPPNGSYGSCCRRWRSSSQG